MMSPEPDLVVVGGGIAGACLALIVARAGLDVVVLEQQDSYRDRVRGETMAPWGVAEATRAGVLEPLLDAEGSFVATSVPYDEVLTPAEAEAQAVNLRAVVPGVAGQLDLSHPQACQRLLDAALGCGARVQRPVREVRVTPGAAPEVGYLAAGRAGVLRPRMVVGADGRSSKVRHQLGLTLQESPPATFGWGLLVDDVAGWPRDTVAIGAEGDLLRYVFPRRGDRARLYLLCPPEQRNRFAGPAGARAFLASFGQLRSLPHADVLAGGTPAGPCAGYPMQDTWLETPYRAGVVLIGDAAGYNDPVTGQGLSLAIRDARALAEILTSTARWQEGILAPYAQERAERMRRLRLTAATYARWRATFTDQGRRLRRAAFDRIAADPSYRLPVAAALVGPDALPPHAFTPAAADSLLGAA